jgi:hypothetical protein
MHRKHPKREIRKKNREAQKYQQAKEKKDSHTSRPRRRRTGTPAGQGEEGHRSISRPRRT